MNGCSQKVGYVESVARSKWQLSSYLEWNFAV